MYILFIATLNVLCGFYTSKFLTWKYIREMKLKLW